VTRVDVERFEHAVRDLPARAAEAGLPGPDEIHLHPKDGEVEFLWREQKLCVVVEIDD
jgi:hypothetical protein